MWHGCCWLCPPSWPCQPSTRSIVPGDQLQPTSSPSHSSWSWEKELEDPSQLLSLSLSLALSRCLTIIIEQVVEHPVLTITCGDCRLSCETWVNMWRDRRSTYYCLWRSDALQIVHQYIWFLCVTIKCFTDWQIGRLSIPVCDNHQMLHRLSIINPTWQSDAQILVHIPISQSDAQILVHIPISQSDASPIVDHISYMTIRCTDSCSKKIKTSNSLIIVLQAIEKDCQVPTTNLCNLSV